VRLLYASKLYTVFLPSNVHPEFIIGWGRGWPWGYMEFVFKNCYKNCTYLQLNLYTYKYNYMFHDSPNLNHKVPPVTSHEGPSVEVVYLCPFFNLNARCGWAVSDAPRPLNLQERELVLVQEAWWASGSIWTSTKYLAPSEFEPGTVQPIASFNFYFFGFKTVMY